MAARYYKGREFLNTYDTKELVSPCGAVSIFENLHQLHLRPPLRSVFQLSLNPSQFDIGFTKLEKFYFDLS